MQDLLIKNGLIVNEGKILPADIRVKEGRIERIDRDISPKANELLIDAAEKYVLPGVIDDQVHFREPGLTHKASIYTEARAAVAGGTTSFMEMPNTVPNALTQDLLQDKYDIAEKVSLANYSFYMGASNDNYDEVMRTDLKEVCGLKIFMGSSTGNMLVDSESTLSKLFGSFPGLIATHCEDEATVRGNMEKYKALYAGKEVPYDIHALVRNEEGCYISSSMAVALAKKHKTRLHILHISSSEEIDLFDNQTPLAEKHITAEVCVHHLWFDAEDYKEKGTQIKCNPAIKHDHRENLFQALLDNHFDVIATDHAPHQWEEKQKDYWSAPSGLPLVQHSLLAMLDFYKKGKISLERIVEKMAHAPAVCFKVKERGYIREGYWADLAIVDLAANTPVTNESVYYKCGWTPFAGHQFGSRVTDTIVSGHWVYSNGKFNEEKNGLRLKFNH
ncbi:dihydroorotase [Marinilongibacter aquaticus]|uniref:dihydroorotase n=1 Tax=Marinilongibacter aquaticus TaxID=2975157 RepID=UPI0021BDA66A|nr:dihydroorotase [Marinilongibacter aquaticus]UBM57933.1 dihydroorotase [Marinilongibacter aquaticus]